MNDLPPLVADGGELRLARRVASYVYGRREVTWPEDVDDPEDNLPDEREFGWVAKLPGPEPGLSERRFVRGDVQIDAVENVSNVEELLDESASRAGGDVFFESMIEGRGLGRLKPGVDFDEGDLVDVRFWGRILPDQLVTSIEWHDGVPSVKIGGQLTSDTNELARARAETIRLITQERKERSGDVAEARSMAIAAQSTADTARGEADTARSEAVTAQSAADTAQSTADTARGEVQQVRDTLAGEQAQQPDLLTQLVAVNDELQRLGQEPQPSLMLAFVSLSTALWQAQQKINQQQQLINDQQAEINAQQKQINEQTRELAEANRTMINLLHLNNHGAWSLSRTYTLKADTWTSLYFGKPKGDVVGCEQGDLSNSEGSFVRFLEAGQWEVSARFYVPGQKLLNIGGTTELGLVLMRSGQRVDYAQSDGYDKGWYYTLSIRTVFNVQKNDYMYVRARSASDRGDGPLSVADTNDAYSELIVRQLSRG